MVKVELMLPLFTRLLKNSNFVFFIALLLGLLYGDPAAALKGWMTPALVFIMSLSATQVTLRELADWRNFIRDVFVVFCINYLFLSGLILWAGHLLVKDPDLRAGLVVMAAVPPAVAVLPFTYLLKGEMAVALLGSASLYFFGLIMAPLISFIFLDVGRMHFADLALTLVQLIVIPFLVSRILVGWKGFQRIKVHTGLFVNLAFFLIIYIVIGINRSAFRRFDVLALVSLIAFLRTFVSGHIIDLVCRFVRIDRPRRMAYVLFGSFKNLGLAATLSLLLFDQKAAIPSAVTIPFEILFFIWFNYFQRKWG